MKYTAEQIREYRQAKLERKLARMRAKAERLEKIAEQKQAGFNKYRGDIAFLTQPASPSSSFGKQRARLYGSYDKGIALQVEADELRKKAEWIERRGVAVKGDAERKRQAQREQMDQLIRVGSKVYDFAFREGEVTRVNKKTYTIRFPSGFTCARDKAYVKPL